MGFKLNDQGVVDIFFWYLYNLVIFLIGHYISSQLDCTYLVSSKVLVSTS